VFPSGLAPADITIAPPMLIAGTASEKVWLTCGRNMEASLASGLFGTVPTSNYLGLFGAGQPDLRKTAEFLEFKKNDVATATNIPVQSVRFDARIPAEAKERLTEIATVCELVAEHFRGDIAKTVLWFRVANPLLGNISPRDQIRLGRYRKVLKFVLQARDASRPSG
jgi:hypothetical protein